MTISRHQTRKKPFFSLKNNFTRKQKRRLTSQLLDLKKDDMVNDFSRLRELGCHMKKGSLSRIGNNVVNPFTMEERLNTIGNKGANFFDVWEHRDMLTQEYPYLKKMLRFYKMHKKGVSEIKMWWRIFNLYYGSISIFKPLTAMEFYCKFKPTTVLDFTMGWGGRLVGACALDVPNYIGIDSNQRLAAPYKKLSEFLAKHSKTHVTTFFQDALTVDYSKLDYDMVLTSPPYYNLEIYGAASSNSHNKTKDEWDNDFYKLIFEKTFRHLKSGGYYCLNIPAEVYERAAVKVLGKAHQKIAMPKSRRNKSRQEKYEEEYVYVWKGGLEATSFAVSPLPP
jgi:hypothetical protein